MTGKFRKRLTLTARSVSAVAKTKLTLLSICTFRFEAELWKTQSVDSFIKAYDCTLFKRIANGPVHQRMSRTEHITRLKIVRIQHPFAINRTLWFNNENVCRRFPSFNTKHPFHHIFGIFVTLQNMKLSDGSILLLIRFNR